MVYMGSKRRFCKDIVPIIQKYIDDNNIDIFFDCFCGGANLTDKINCEKVCGNDISPTLIALHKQAQQDFEKIPKDGDRKFWDTAYAEWKKIRQAINNKEPIPKTEMELYKIGAIEWYSSFANGGFPRGYAKSTNTRNYYQEAYRNHKKQAQNSNYKKIVFNQSDYKNLAKLKDFTKDHNLLFYCDAPYRNTKPYGIQPKFNFDEYYNWLREVSNYIPIFISEQYMPEDFQCIWEKEAKRTAGKDNNFQACEKLFFIDNRRSK